MESWPLESLEQPIDLIIEAHFVMNFSFTYSDGEMKHMLFIFLVSLHQLDESLLNALVIS